LDTRARGRPKGTMVPLIRVTYVTVLFVVTAKQQFNASTANQKLSYKCN